VDRFISIYTNAGYSISDDLQISASLRRDASNLFGVRQNQRWTPLWSAGLSYNFLGMLKETPKWIDNGRIRFTYGYNGNLDKGTSAYVVASYSNDGITGLPRAQIQNPGNSN